MQPLPDGHHLLFSRYHSDEVQASLEFIPGRVALRLRDSDGATVGYVDIDRAGIERAVVTNLAAVAPVMRPGSAFKLVPQRDGSVLLDVADAALYASVGVRAREVMAWPVDAGSQPASSADPSLEHMAEHGSGTCRAILRDALQAPPDDDRPAVALARDLVARIRQGVVAKASAPDQTLPVYYQGSKVGEAEVRSQPERSVIVVVTGEQLLADMKRSHVEVSMSDEGGPAVYVRRRPGGFTPRTEVSEVGPATFDADPFPVTAQMVEAAIEWCLGHAGRGLAAELAQDAARHLREAWATRGEIKLDPLTWAINRALYVGAETAIAWADREASTGRGPGAAVRAALLEVLVAHSRGMVTMHDLERADDARLIDIIAAVRDGADHDPRRSPPRVHREMRMTDPGPQDLGHAQLPADPLGFISAEQVARMEAQGWIFTRLDRAPYRRDRQEVEGTLAYLPITHKHEPVGGPVDIGPGPHQIGRRLMTVDDFRTPEEFQIYRAGADRLPLGILPGSWEGHLLTAMAAMVAAGIERHEARMSPAAVHPTNEMTFDAAYDALSKTAQKAMDTKADDLRKIRELEAEIDRLRAAAVGDHRRDADDRARVRDILLGARGGDADQMARAITRALGLVGGGSVAPPPGVRLTYELPATDGVTEEGR